MASIYYYYNEVLRQSAQNAAVWHANCGGDGVEDLQQQEAAAERPTGQKRSEKPVVATTPADAQAKENQDEAGEITPPSKTHVHSEASLATLQPRMNRLAYLSSAALTNLDALARSLGPKE